jgi:16S rRNA (cytosine1402-N4)-methyltransferase
LDGGLGLLEDLHNVMRTRPIQSSSDPVPSQGHRSVLLQEAIDLLDIQESDTVVDATLGGAGHAKEIVARLGTAGTFIGFDLDHDAIARAEIALAGAKCKVELIEKNFREMGNALKSFRDSSGPARSVREIDKAIFDLGWSSFQLEAGRGFSFNTNDPLLMTYSTNPSSLLTAAEIVNLWSEESLADVIYGWGEERYSRRIARALVERRQRNKFTTAKELAGTIASAVPAAYRRGKLHPATKTFQALRIAVNDELGALKEGLESAFMMLRPHGRIAVITFHSIEDRLVKQYFAGLEKEGKGKRVNKKPIGPGDAELAENPRARSAKIRVFEKVDQIQ